MHMDDLLHRGANPNATNRHGQTPLGTLAFNSPMNEREYRLQMMKKLTEHDADVNHSGQHDMSPFHDVCRSGWDEAASHLLRRGARIDSTYHAPSWTALHLAARRGHTSTVDLLLSKGADADRMDDSGQTPADIAHKNDWTEISKRITDASRRRRSGFP